jgi:AcrR family transcriptional regulator
MSVKRVKPKTGRPVKVPGEKGTKDRIFDAAVDLFADRGYDGVSVRDIARAVGLTEGAVYKHYASKEDILNAIFAYVENRLYTPQSTWTNDLSSGRCSFEEIIGSMPRAMASEPFMIKLTRIMLIEMYRNEKIREYVRRNLFDRPVDETDALLRLLVELGVIKPCNTRAMSTMIIAYLTYWYFETFVFSNGSPSDMARREEEAQAQIRAFGEMLKPEGVQA